MSEKKRRDITLGEMQKKCVAYDCANCDPSLANLCRSMQTEEGEMKAPKFWDLTDPPRFNEAQMALLRMMMGMGAEYATQQNGSLSFYTAEPMRRAAIIDQRILNDGETVCLAELLGKDAT